MSDAYHNLEQEEQNLIDYMRATRSGGSSRRAQRVMSRRGVRPGFWEGDKNLIGSNLGQDWRKVEPTTVSRRPSGPMIKPGSGLDTQSRLLGRSIKAKLPGRQAERTAEMESEIYGEHWEPQVYDQEAEVSEAPAEPENSIEGGAKPPHWARTWSASKAIMNDPEKFAAKRGEFLVRQEQRGGSMTMPE